MLVGSLAQAGGLSTIPPISPNSHPRKSRACRRRLEGGGGVKSKAQADQAVSARTFGQFSQLDHYRVVRSEDCLSILDTKHKLFYRICELILSIAEERQDDLSKPAVMSSHTMSLAASQFLNHLDLLPWICLAQLLVHRGITTNVISHDDGTKYGRQFLVDYCTVPSVPEAGYKFRYDGRLKWVRNTTQFLRLSKDHEVTSSGHERLRGQCHTRCPLALSCRGRCDRCSFLQSKEVTMKA